MKIKLLIKIILITTLSIYAIMVIRNIYLYLTYERNEFVFTKNHDSKGIEGHWSNTYESMDHGQDKKHTNLIYIRSDSTGVFVRQFQDQKINGEMSSTYSWSSLLPYEQPQLGTVHKISVDAEYIKFLPGDGRILTFPAPDDTLFSRYKISSDSLYIDGMGSKHRYDCKQNLLTPHSYRFSISFLLCPWKWNRSNWFE